MALDELKNIIKETPISQIIGHYLPLVRRGNQTLAKCPFHDDKHPSLNVNDSKQMFMCFACNTGGDAISFVENYRHINYVESLEEISKLLGLDFESYQEKTHVSPRLETARKILKVANKIYQQLEQVAAYKHFLESRKINTENAQKFQLGYSPGNNILSNYLGSIKDEADRKQAIEVALEIGIIKKDKKGGHYDTFRDRIMFPIWDLYGKVMGFTSRATLDYQKPKYLNSPASMVFDKKNLLYGLNFAKSFIRQRDRIILCEGNMDTIALHQNGFEEAVAIMGTALGPYAFRTLKNYSQNFYLALDNDQAGKEAAKRVLTLCLKEKIIPWYVDFGDEKDPDDFINKHGIVGLEKALKSARPYIDLILEELIPKKIPEVSDHKLKILQKAFEVLAPLGMSLSATERIVPFSQRLALKSGPQQVLENYKNFISQSGDEAPVRVAPRPSTPPPDQVKAPKAQTESLTRGEKIFLKAILENPMSLDHNAVSKLLDLIPSPEVKEYVLKLRNLIYEVDEGEYSELAQTIINQGDYPLSLRESVSIILYGLKPGDSWNRDETFFTKLMSDIETELLLDQKLRRKKELKSLFAACESEQERKIILGQIIDIEKDIATTKSQKNKNH
ncbi:MAG: DNA primase [Bacteriovoracaceae bacterium]